MVINVLGHGHQTVGRPVAPRVCGTLPSLACAVAPSRVLLLDATRRPAAVTSPVTAGWREMAASMGSGTDVQGGRIVVIGDTYATAKQFARSGPPSCSPPA